MTDSFQSSETEGFDPINICRIVVSDGRKVCGLAVETTYEKKVLRELGEMAENLNVTILYIQVSMPEPGAETAKALAFLDLTNSEVSPEQIEELLKKQEFVKSVEVISPSKYGFVADTHFFPLLVDDKRAVMFRKEIYEGIFEGIRRKFGSAGEAFLYYEGFEVGKRAYDSYRRFARERSSEAMVEVAKAVNTTLGWGMIKDVRINEETKTATLKLYGNFECELGKGSGRAYSQFYRGAIAGMFTKCFKEEMKAEETRCIAKGDPYCEFTVSKVSPQKNK